MKPAGKRRLYCTAVVIGALWTGQAASAAGNPPVPKKLGKSAKMDLLLNRFTFGATAADRLAVQQAGVDAWLLRQLQPERIDDYELERRLDMYPALRMSQAERLQRYPDPATLRQIAKSGVLPSDPELHAIIADQVEFYGTKQQARISSPSNSDAALGVRQPGGTSDLVKLDTKPGGTQEASPQASAAPKPREQVDAILLMPPLERYGRLLSMAPTDLIAVRQSARGPLEEKLAQGMTPLQKETLLALSGTNRMISAEVQGARLLRDVYSRRQVEAVMTDFWLNHFNVFSGKSGQEPSLLPQYEKTIRAHALGRFEDLLVAVAKSPAMLVYLDNSSSTGPDSIAATRQRKNTKGRPGLNENYARELMELHTLGVNGGYTQQDVMEVAKVFTGWTLERPNDGGNYTFNANRHEPGSKVVLGEAIPEDGEAEGLQVLHMLASSPATAHFVSLEIAQRFVSDAPPAAVVQRMTKAFLSTGGDMRQVLLAMVHSPEFFTAATVHAKLKTPLEYVTSAVRISGAEITNPQPLTRTLQQLGMPLYGCQSPSGYSWADETWLSSSALVNRMNFALSLSNNRLGGVVVDWSSVPAGKIATLMQTSSTPEGVDPEAAQKEALLETRLFQEPVSAQTRLAVLLLGSDTLEKQSTAAGSGRPPVTVVQPAGQHRGQHGAPSSSPDAAKMKSSPASAEIRAASMAALLLGSPEFQRR